MSTPTTDGYTLAAIDADLDEVRANVDHAEATYQPHALTALRAAERLRQFAADVDAALNDTNRSDLHRLARITVAHARLIGGAR